MIKSVRALLTLPLLASTLAVAVSPFASAADWPYPYAIKSIAWDGDLPTLGGQPTRSRESSMSGNGWVAATVQVTANASLTGTVMRRDPTTGAWTDIGYPADASYGFHHGLDIQVNNLGTVAVTIDKEDSPSGLDLIAYRRIGDAGWTLPTSTTRNSQAWQLETNGNRFLAGRGRDDALGVPLPGYWSDAFAFTDISSMLTGCYGGNIDGLYGNAAVVVWGTQTESTNEEYRWSFISDITAVSPTITHLTKVSSPAISRTVPVSGGGTAAVVGIHDAKVTATHVIFAYNTINNADDPNGVISVPLASIDTFTGAAAVPRPRIGDLSMQVRGANSSGLISGVAGPFVGSTTTMDDANRVGYLYRIGDATSKTMFELSGWNADHAGQVAEDNAMLDGANLFVPVPTVDLTATDAIVGPSDTSATVRLTRSSGSLLLPLNLTISWPVGVTASILTPMIPINASYVDVTLTIPTSEVGNKTISLLAPMVPTAGNFWGQATSAYNRGSNRNVIINNANAVNNPTTTITRIGGSSTVARGQTATIQVVFSVAVTGFIANELQASSGILSAFTGSGTTYSATWTPTDGVDFTTVAFNVAASVAQTTTGSNLFATTLSVPFDTLAPSAPTITSPTNGATIGANPTVTGTIPSGATAISVTAASTTQTASLSGSWSSAFTGLAAGSTAIAATAFDAAGNASTAASMTVTVDASAPVLMVGTITSPTADPTVAISGTVDENCTLTVRDGATPVYGPTAATAGAWGPIETSALMDGAHSMTVTAVDSLGNFSTSSAQSVTTDTTGPTVAFGAPSASVVNSTATPTIVATYSDVTTTVAAITLMAGNVTVNTTGSAAGTAAVTGSGMSNRSITLSGLTGDGTITIQVGAGTATDAVANTASASAVSAVITVDNTAPTVVISTSATTTNDSTPTIAGTAEAGSTVELREGATVLGSAVATGGNWSLDATTLGEGVHTLFARAVDGAGNVGMSVSVVITIDLTPPAVAITTVAGATTVTTPAISGTAEVGSTVQLREGTTVLGSVVASGGTWMITASVLSEGVHNLTAQATDLAGNVTTTSAVAITVDTTAPGIVLGTPSAVANVKSGNTVTILVTYSDAGSGLGAVTLVNGNVTVTTASGTATATAAVSGSGSTRTITLSSFTGDGTITVSLATATATDAVGNSAAAAGPSTAIAVDNTAPVVAITTGTTITADTTPTIIGTCDDNSATIELRNGSTVLGTSTVTAGVWSVTPVAALTAGTYSLIAHGTDVAGNVGASAAVQVMVNLSGPTVVISGGTISGTTATFTVTFSSAVVGLTASDFLTGGTAGGTKTVTVTPDVTNRIYTVTVTGLAAPSGTVTVSLPADVATAVVGSDPTQPSNSVSATFTVPGGTTPTVTVVPTSAVSDDGDGGGRCGLGGLAGLLSLCALFSLRLRRRT